MNTKVNKIRFAIMHNPTLIPALLRDTSVNNGLIYRELHKAVPCRIGIEFEMGNQFLAGFKHKYDEKATDASMAKHYRVHEIRSDSEPLVSNRTRVIRATAANMDDIIVREGEPGYERAVPEDPPIIETRVSIKDFHQLSGLYRFMQDLPEFCLLHEGGGIHIHIDMSKFNMSDDKTKEVQRYITNRLDMVGSIFPPYKGKYNKKEVGIQRKSTWVNISAIHTLEFRIAPLTFDYSTLMKWITGVVKFRNKLVHECRLVSKRLDLKDIQEVVCRLETLSQDLEVYNTVSSRNWTVTDQTSDMYWAS